MRALWLIRRKLEEKQKFSVWKESWWEIINGLSLFSFMVLAQESKIMLMKFADTQIYEASSTEVDWNFILKERCQGRLQ